MDAPDDPPPPPDTRRKALTPGAKACAIIDALVAALDGEASSSLRRALILADITAHPGTTLSEAMARLEVPKSAMIREVDWLFDHGCIQREEHAHDARARRLFAFGVALDGARTAQRLAGGGAQNLRSFLQGFMMVIKKARPTLRDAKILSVLYDRGQAEKREVIEALYDGPPTTEYRALAELIEEGMIEDDETGTD
jgi:predicted ArsR family transcriptional regulator